MPPGTCAERLSSVQPFSSPLQKQRKTKNPAHFSHLASAFPCKVTIFPGDTDLDLRKKTLLPPGAVIHQKVILKFSKRTDSAQLTATVGLNDILKSNQADYIMHQNMVKWYSFAAMLKEHLIFLWSNTVSLSRYWQEKRFKNCSGRNRVLSTVSGL